MNPHTEPNRPAPTGRQTGYRSIVFDVAHDPDTDTIHASHSAFPALHVTASTLEGLAAGLARTLAEHLRHQRPADP